MLMTVVVAAVTIGPTPLLVAATAAVDRLILVMAVTSLTFLAVLGGLAARESAQP
jgi:hypothetical protein